MWERCVSPIPIASIGRMQASPNRIWQTTIARSGTGWRRISSTGRLRLSVVPMGRLAHHQELRAGGGVGNVGRRSQAICCENHEIAAQGKNLRRLLAQLVGADGGCGVFDARPRGRGGLRAGDVGGTGSHQERQSIHAAQPGQATKWAQAGPVEGYRSAEAALARSARAAASVSLADVERLSSGRLAGGIERDLLHPGFRLTQSLLAAASER